MNASNYTREVPGSNLGRDIDYPDWEYFWCSSVPLAFYSVRSYNCLQVQKVPSIIAQPLPSTSFPLHYTLASCLFTLHGISYWEHKYNRSLKVAVQGPDFWPTPSTYWEHRSSRNPFLHLRRIMQDVRMKGIQNMKFISRKLIVIQVSG
jgi:hypothetical protein